jgi:hypothetical protein
MRVEEMRLRGRTMPTEKNGFRARRFFRALTAAAAAAVGLVSCSGPQENELALGEAAKADSVEVVLQSPVELDFKTKAEVLQLRREAVARYPQLLAREYAPSEAVFGKVADGLPWWGIAGHFYYDTGERSIAGPSEESRFILNPFLLAAAEFNASWMGVIAEQEVSTFPLYCPPRGLHWFPRQSYAEVAYDASCISMRMNVPFNLIAYNARDLGLNYVFVSYPHSLNISKQDPPQTAYANPQFLHQGGSCGYPGGCNNMSPSTPEINGLRITALPAGVTVWFWSRRPASTEQKPDMTFIVRFQ